MVRVNVGGRTFELPHNICARIPVLKKVMARTTWKRGVGKMAFGTNMSVTDASEKKTVGNIDLKEELFFRRNSTIFAAVVDYVQGNELHVPQHTCPKLFARDLNFWGFDIDEVASCCFPGTVQFLWEREKVDNFNSFLENRRRSGPGVSLDEEQPISRYQTLRATIWDILDEPYANQIAQFYFSAMCLFILLSFCVIAVDTVDSFKVNFVENGVTKTKSMHAITVLSNMCAIYLFIDFTLRLVFCPKLSEFFLDVTNVTDTVAVLSSVAKILTENVVFVDADHPVILKSISTLKFLRIMRLLRPMSKVKGFRLIYFTLKCSFHELLLVLMLLGFLTMVFSTLLYYLGDSESFKSIPHAMWFSLTTMTTVGYGDIIPHRFDTKIVGSVVAVFGIIMMSMTMPIMVSNFNSLYTNAMLGQPLGSPDVDADKKEWADAKEYGGVKPIKEKEGEGLGQREEVGGMISAFARPFKPTTPKALKNNVSMTALEEGNEEDTEEKGEEEEEKESSLVEEATVSDRDGSAEGHLDADDEKDGEEGERSTSDIEDTSKELSTSTIKDVWRRRVRVLGLMNLFVKPKPKPPQKTFSNLMAALKVAHRARLRSPRFRPSVSV